MYENNHYTVEYWDESRGLWIDVFQTHNETTAMTEYRRKKRIVPHKWRVVYVTAKEVLQVS